jgi:dienelactone hydrolase
MIIHTLTSVKTEGFMGRLFTTETISKKSVIVITGSDGGIKNAEYIARKFAECGINALAVAYFKIKGVKRDLNEVPVEYIEKATSYLKEKTSCEKVAIYGISKGGELSLLSASLFPDIDCVVAVVPNYFVTSGFNKIGCPIGNVSAWSFLGKPFPFIPVVANPLNIFKSYLKDDVNIKGYYKAIVEAEITEEAVIKVENSHAAILCLSALHDIVWPSKMASEKVVERLKNVEFPYDFEHRCFEKVSHFLCPLPENYAKKPKLMFKIEKQYPNECDESREKAFEMAVEWIKKHNNADNK